MKWSFGVAIIVMLWITFGVWRADAAKDRQNTVVITEAVSAYNNWKCGYKNQPDCIVVFEVGAGAVFEAQRIRYGKDFMAIQINQHGSTGWVFSGKGVQVNAKPKS